MVTSRRNRPADVIALSPFRAELGRGRRLRRADALYDAPELGAAVRALPGDELYYVLHEVGLRDGAALLAAATAEQIQIVLDFALWERDRISDEPLDEWLEAIAGAPIERIGRWLAGIDSELFGLILRRRARIYDLSQEGPPDEPEGTFYPTPDGLFVLDVTGGTAGEGEHEPAAVLIRIVDALYRTDKALARRILIGARSELDAELEENAFRWRQARMADLGFADYYEALEVYRELDPASVGLTPPPAGEDADRHPRAGGPRGAAGEDALRVPTALAERLRDTSGSPFARAAQKLGDGRAVEDLRAALVALTNRVLAADRIVPADDEAVEAVLDRLAATLDLAVERLAAGDDARGATALARLPLVRLFRLGFSLTARVRRLALALRNDGPFGPRGISLVEPEDASVLEAVMRARPMFPRFLDEPPAGGERPFRRLIDLSRAVAGVERAAAAQAVLSGLGVTRADLAPGSPPLTAAGADDAALDVAVVARTVLVQRLLAPSKPGSKPAFDALDAADVRAFEARLRPTRPAAAKLATQAAKLPPDLEKRARAMLAAATPPAVAGPAAAVIDRWVASLAPLEPVLVRRARSASRAPKRRR